jgi:hypothetical protein
VTSDSQGGEVVDVVLGCDALYTRIVKVKPSRFTPWRRLGREEYSSYSFTTSALDGGEWSASRPGRAFTPGERTPGTHCTGGWVGLRAGLDTEDRGKILCPCRGSNPDRPVVQPVVRHYTAWANPAPSIEIVGCLNCYNFGILIYRHVADTSTGRLIGRYILKKCERLWIRKTNALTTQNPDDQVEFNSGAVCWRGGIPQPNFDITSKW